jgi:hypothetical protein
MRDLLNKKKNPNDSISGSQTSITDADSSQTVSDENELVHEVMSDNLDLMLEIIMKVREDEDFAKSIYADCPRLQHLLDQHPDLRPIFEDPNLVRINFEQVYRNAGGVLPEDKPSQYMKIVKCIVNHPLFKVFKFLLLIKKIYKFFVGGGYSMIRNCFMSLFAADSLHGALPDGDVPDVDVDGGSLDNQVHQEALYKAADHMSDPAVQEQMSQLLEMDPDQLEEAIEQDPDLSALRQLNPLCAELMNDPSTLKILVDPDNLRALGDCPDLIQADFASPDWNPPDLESYDFDDATGGQAGTESFFDADGDFDADVDADGDVDTDVDADGNVDTDVDADGDVDTGVEGEEGEGEEQQQPSQQQQSSFMDEYERGDDTQAANKQQQKSRQNDNKKNDEQGGGGGGYFSTYGTGLLNYVAAQTVGTTFSDLMGGTDDFGLDGLDDQAAQAADSAAASADTASSFADRAQQTVDNAQSFSATASTVGDLAASDAFTSNLESTMDNVEEAADCNEEQDREQAMASGAATGLAIGAAGMGAVGIGAAGVGAASMVRGTSRSAGDDDEEEEEREDRPMKGKLGRLSRAIGGTLAAFGTATKEYAVTAVVGADLAKEILDKMDENKKEDENGDEKEGKDKENMEEQDSQRNFFGRRK